MSEDQVTALLARLKDDAGLKEKLKGAADIDAAVAIAMEAGFDVSKGDWLKYQAKQQTFELSDGELEAVAGGKFGYGDSLGCEPVYVPREYTLMPDGMESRC